MLMFISCIFFWYF